nr:MDR family MFS transporter [Micromonospora tarapacensis]
MFLASVDQTIVAAALPTVVGDLGAPDQYAWVLTAYLLAETAATPVFGKAGDLYGRKRVLQVSVLVFAVGSVLCALAGAMWQLAAFRAVQGIGAGGIIAATLGVVADLIPPRERGRYQGAYVSVFALAAILGPPLGGVLVDGPGWRWAFWGSAVLAVAVLVVISMVLTLPAVTRTVAVDWWGAALLVAAVSAVVLAVSLGGRHLAWTSPPMLALLAAATCLVVLFVRRERAFVEPMLPPGMFTEPVFTVSVLLAFLTGGIMLGALAFLPQFLQLAQGFSATVAGLALVPVLAAALVASTIVGRWVSRIGRYRPFPILGMGALCLGLALLTQLQVDTPYPLLVVPLLLLGVGVGMSTPVLFVAVQNAADPRHVGVASAAVTFFRSLGGAIGAAVFGAVLIARLDVNLVAALPDLTGGVNAIIDAPRQVAMLAPETRDAVREAYAASFRQTILAAVGLSVGAWLLSWRLPDRELGDGTPTSAVDEQREEVGNHSPKESDY